MGDDLLDCDIIMRGGITSGVVYPGVLCELATRYRFRNIGGASAGAIAAGVAAAAEFGRQHGVPDAFDRVVAKIPDSIGAGEAPARSGGPAQTSFQTMFGGRGDLGAVMAMLLALKEGRHSEVVSAALRRYGQGLALTFLLAFAAAIAAGAVLKTPSAPGSMGIAIAFALVCAAGIVLTARRIKADADVFSRNFKSAGFGLATGVNPDVQGQPADEMVCRGGFADWLHVIVQQAAGRDVADDPLRVRDLWGSNDPWAPERRIDLVLTTTNITQQLPHRFPFLARPSQLLYFHEDELKTVLPWSVVEAMKGGDTETLADGRIVHALPAPEDLPILLGIRMSLSFPLMISAVRLYEKPPGFAQRPRPCWFSDGGITSNFPVSVFDAPLPGRPTFCINLADLPAGALLPGELISLPSNNDQGIVAPHRADIDKGNVGDFLMAIVDTARNAAENDLMTTPGHRERIVTIRLDPANEGGLNLNMPPETIERLAGRGRTAARWLIARFHPDEAAEGDAWANHRWVRLRALLAGLEGTLVRIASAWERKAGSEPSYAEAMAEPRCTDGAYHWASHKAQALACAQVEEILTAARSLAEAETGRPDVTVFNGRRDKHGNPLGRRYGAPVPAMSLQLRPVGSRDPLRG